MIRSMTGFGKAVADQGKINIAIEISAVNHRYFDCNFRLPTSWSALENPLKARLKKKVARGKITVTISRKYLAASQTGVVFDEAVARQYIDASKSLSKVMGSGETVSIDTIASLPGIFSAQEPQDEVEDIEEQVAAVLDAAIENFNTARAREGEALAKDVTERITDLESMVAGIEEVLPEIRERYAQRLTERVAELVSDTALTEDRLALEVAIMAEKSDVTEEVVRLKAHFEHTRELLASSEPIGRKLDFLCQELQREMNTLGVKTRDSSVARVVLDLKSELEKIREQAQNIE